MSRGLLGAAAGAGGASVYFSGLGDSLRYVLDAGMGFNRGSGGASLGTKQYDELYRMVQQLSQEVGRKQQGITIMHGSDSKSSAVYYVAVVAAGGVIYLRVFRGWKLVDMMYVTRASLKQSVGHLSEGLEGLGQRLTSVKTYLQSQIRALTAKQDQTIAAQAAMKEHLNVVGSDVEATRGEVSEMHSAVRELEANMEQMSLSQQYANRGIYILCKVVGDMMKGPAGGGGSRGASAAELENYVRHPPTIGGRIVPGLEGLLQDSELDSSSVSRSGPTPFSRNTLEQGRLARAATESAMHGPKRFPLGTGGGSAALDRSFSTHSTDGYAGAHHRPSSPEYEPETPQSHVGERRRYTGGGAPRRNAYGAWERAPSNASSYDGGSLLSAQG